MVPSRSTSHGAPTRSAERFQPSIDVVALPGRPETGVCCVRPAVPCQTTYFLSVISGNHWPRLRGYGLMFIGVLRSGGARASARPTGQLRGWSDVLACLEVALLLLLLGQVTGGATARART